MSRQLVIGMLIGFGVAVALISWASSRSKDPTADAGSRFVPYARTQMPEKLMVQLKPLMFAGADGGS